MLVGYFPNLNLTQQIISVPRTAFSDQQRLQTIEHGSYKMEIWGIFRPLLVQSEYVAHRFPEF